MYYKSLTYTKAMEKKYDMCFQSKKSLPTKLLQYACLPQHKILEHKPRLRGSSIRQQLPLRLEFAHIVPK